MSDPPFDHDRHQSSAPAADLLPAVRALPRQEGGIPAGGGVLVALSGGPDSTALLDLLARLRGERALRLVAAHLDHGLRPDSALDAIHCARLCARLDVPFRTRREPVGRLARRWGVGLEAAGRHARYVWLRTLRVQEDLDLVATGHHLDDHAETLLLCLLRGAGLAGLRGIAPRRGRLVRPLRRFRRGEIAAYLAWRGLPALEDGTNRSPRFARNRVRHELLPLLEQLAGGGIAERLDRLGRQAAADVAFLQRLSAQRLARPGVVREVEGGLLVDRSAFQDLPVALRYYALRQVLARLSPTWLPAPEPQRWTRLAARRLLGLAIGGPAGRRTALPGGGWLWVDRETLRFQRAPEPAAATDGELLDVQVAAGRLKVELLPQGAAAVRLATDRTACFDADAIHPPLRVRRARAGDRMRPHGMSGRKRLVRLFQEHGVPGDLRGKMLVVEDRERIVWAVGVTTCDETRVGPATRRVLKLTLEGSAPAPVAKHDERVAGKDPGTA